MWIVKLALNRPYTFLVAALLILILSPVVILGTPGTPGMPVDIFPNIDIPVVSILWNYAGFSPQQMEQRIVTPTERGLTTIVNDIEHTESQSLNGIGVIKVYFHPSVRSTWPWRRSPPFARPNYASLPGTTPPLIIQYSASSVPILQLSSEQQDAFRADAQRSFAQLHPPPLDQHPGRWPVPIPMAASNGRSMVDIDIPKLQAMGLTPSDVVNAISAQNLILPSGTAKIGPLEYDIALNGSPQTVEELNNLPIKTVNGAIIYVRDVAHVRDGFSPQTNIVRQDGVRSTLISIMKNGDVSTLDIVARRQGPDSASSSPALPDDLHIRTLFDQSIFVRAAIEGVIREGIIAACLTALMILLFLGDWKSTMIIAISIPLSVLSSFSAQRAGRDDQHHDAGRAGPGRRYSGR